MEETFFCFLLQSYQRMSTSPGLYLFKSPERIPTGMYFCLLYIAWSCLLGQPFRLSAQVPDYLPEPWEYQEKKAKVRVYTKPVSLSQWEEKNRSDSARVLRTQNLKPELTKSDTTTPDTTVGTDESHAPLITPKENPIRNHPSENPTPLTTDFNQSNASLKPGESGASDLNQDLKNDRQLPKVTAVQPAQNAMTPAPLPPGVNRPPVITSLDKNLPSLTRFNSRREKSIIQLPARLDLLDSLDFSFLQWNIPEAWIPQAPMLEYPISSETINRFKANWNPRHLSAFHQILEGIRPLLPQSDGVYYLYVFHCSQKFYPNHLNEARLLTELLMQAAGFKVVSAYYQDEILLMVNTAQPLYEITRITAGHTEWKQEDWFFWEPGSRKQRQGEFYMPDITKVRELKPLNLKYLHQGSISGDSVIRKIEYYDPVTKTQDAFQVVIDQSMVKILGALPQMSPEIYFEAPVSKEVYSTLIEPLKSRVSGMRTYESLSWLLRFVQQAFPYRTDEEQFGKEKAMFLEEGLLHSYTDCEDRSVIFAILVKEVLGRKVIGLDFPGHMAVGVETQKKEARGARVKYRGKIYMACDPSYINGIPGNLPEAMLRQSPKPIFIQRLEE